MQSKDIAEQEVIVAVAVASRFTRGLLQERSVRLERSDRVPNQSSGG